MERFLLDRPAVLPQEVWFSLSSRGLHAPVAAAAPPAVSYGSGVASASTYASNSVSSASAYPSTSAHNQSTTTVDHYARPPLLLSGAVSQHSPYTTSPSASSSAFASSPTSSAVTTVKRQLTNGSSPAHSASSSIDSVCYLFHLCTQPSCHLQHIDYARVFADHLTQGQPRQYRDTRSLPSLIPAFTPLLAESSALLWDSARSRADWLLCIPLPATSSVCKSFIGRQGSTRDVMFGLSKVSWATIAGSALDQLDDQRLVSGRQWVCLWVGGTRQACDVWLECALYCMSHRCLSNVLSGREREDLEVHIEQFKRQWNSSRPVNGCPLLSLTSRGYSTPRYGGSG